MFHEHISLIIAQSHSFSLNVSLIRLLGGWHLCNSNNLNTIFSNFTSTRLVAYVLHMLYHSKIQGNRFKSREIFFEVGKYESG